MAYFSYWIVFFWDMAAWRHPRELLWNSLAAPREARAATFERSDIILEGTMAPSWPERLKLVLCAAILWCSEAKWAVPPERSESPRRNLVLDVHTYFPCISVPPYYGANYLSGELALQRLSYLGRAFFIIEKGSFIIKTAKIILFIKRNRLLRKQIPARNAPARST